MNSKYTGKLVEDLLDKMSIIESGEVGGVISGKIFEKFLRKDQDDRTEHTLASDKLIEVGNFVSGTSGAIIYVDKATGHTIAELDKLYVRMKAYFELLEIINVNSVGGKLIISPAGGLKCSRVETYDSWGYYRCYFLTELDGEKIENRFIVGDLAYSKMFNAKEGTFNKISNRYYWRLVVGIGEDYIDLSKSDCDTDSDAPKENDVIVHRGNRNDVDRLNFIEFSSVDSYSPSITLYQGVNDYTLADKEVVQFGVEKSTGKAFMTVYGDMYIGNRDNTSYIRYSPETGVKIKGSLEIGTKLGDKDLLTAIDEASKSYEEDYRDLIDAINKDLENILKQIDGAIETWFYEPTPTLTNAPANTWTTDEMKNMHLGDLYYSGEGRAYRFLFDVDSGKYYWNEIVDTDIKNALEAAKKAQDTADGKRKIFARLPTNADEYDIGDMWVNANYNGPDPDHTFNNDLVRAIVYKKAGDEFSILHWLLASKYTDDTVAKDALGKAEAALNAASALLNEVGDFKGYVDGAFKDGIIDTSEALAIEKYIKLLDTIKELVEKSYNEISINSILENTKYLTDLQNSYNTFISSYNELTDAIENAIADGKTTDLEKAEVDGKYSNFNGKYGEYTKYLNAAIRYIEEAIDGKALRAIDEIGGYSYLRRALQENTTITGGLILSSMLSLGYTNKAGEFLVMAGTNGLVVDRGERTVASWFGGGMIDMFDYYDSATKTFNVPEGIRVAAGLDRMDGTGYRAKGNLWWDADGIVHADPLSFFVGEATVGGLLASFLVVMKDDGKHPLYIIPQVPFLNLLIADYLLIGDAYLKYDRTNKAIYVTNADGTTDTIGFYAPWVSAKGANSSSSGGGSTSALYLLVDVVANDNNDGVLGALSGSVLMYNGTKWLAGTVVTDISTLTILTNGSTIATYNGKLNITANIVIPTIPTSLKNPYALTFGSNTYDGSAAKTITASDLGALTAHQTIYTLSIIGGSTTVSSFTPNSANDSITFAAGSNISITPDITNKKITIANTYSYTHPTGGADTTITAANGRVLSAITINSLGHTTSVSYKALAAADIPSLDWSKIISGKPTTLAGYGITDGVNSVTINGSGNAITAASISNHVLTLTKDATYLPKATFDDLFEKVNIGTSSSPVYAIRAKYGFYSDEFISAKGVNSSSGGSSASALYQLVDVAPNANNDGVLNASTGKVLMYNGTKWQAGDVVSDISTLTFNVNGSKLFDYNGKSTVTANLTVPTKLSQLTDDVVSGKYLPLSGGTISNSSTHLPLSISAPTMGNYCAIQFKNGNVVLGSLGVSAQNIPSFLNSSGTWFNLLHSGNISSYNAGSASKWQTARTLTLTGSVTGSVSIDGSGNVSLATTTNHTHSYLPLSGGTLFNGTTGTTILTIKAKNSNSDSVLRFTDGDTNVIYEILLRRPTSKFGLQFNSNGIYFNLIHSGNYNYYAPSLTGTGASGTWGISITGNAATASGLFSESDISDANTVSFTDRTIRWYSFVPNTTSNLPTTAGWQNGLLALPLHSNGITAQLYFSATKKPYFRSTQTSDWNEIAYVTDNVASATKLQTARTIWGQHFDGTSDVSGSLTNVVNIESSDYINNAGTFLGTRAIGFNRNTGTGAILDSSYDAGQINYSSRYGGIEFGTAVSTGGYTIRMMLLRDGNLGIGTTAPSQKLHVVGNILATGTVTATAFNGPLNGNAANADKLDGYHATPTSSSSVNPWNTIPVIKSDGVMEIGRYLDFHFDNTSNLDYSCRLQTDANNQNVVRLPSASGTLALTTDNVASATKLQTPRTIWGQSFDGTGNVDGCLHIHAKGTNFVEGIRIYPQQNSWTSIILCGIDNTSNSGTSAHSWSMHTHEGNFYINRNSSNGTTPYILCNVNGNWGLGTNLPDYKLHVVGSTFINGEARFKSQSTSLSINIGYNTATWYGASDSHPMIWGGDGRTFYTMIATPHIPYLENGQNGYTGSTLGAVIRIAANKGTSGTYWDIGCPTEDLFEIKRSSSRFFAITNAGNVGIGTESPSQKLHVVGNIIATGAVTAKASSSDIRLKTDISDYKALSIIRNHRSIKYHWNEAAKANADIFNDNDWHYGLIAQEMQQDLPQMVSDVFKDYLVINYERLIPICWKGLQEVDDEVTRLKKKVRKLEMEIRELKQERV